MQLTSTPEEDRSLRQSAPSPWSRLNRPLVPGIIAFLGWLGFALARWQIWAKGHLSLFIMAGHTFTHRAQLPRGLLLVPSAGYDGQFYYRLALNPVNWSKTAYGITMDQSYRYTRIGYPILAWLVSLGQHQLVPVAMVVINLLGTYVEVIGNELRLAAALAIIVIVLMVRPAGLFGRVTVQRV